MGDRTNVILCILASQQEEALKHFSYEADEAWTEGQFAYHQFYEINYGNLDFLDALVKAGIAHDSNWASGSEYGPGCDYCRFTVDGGVVLKGISDSYRNPPIEKLMEKINDYDALKNFITKHFDEIYVPSWDFQEEYGKIYQTKQLINPT